MTELNRPRQRRWLWPVVIVVASVLFMVLWWLLPPQLYRYRDVQPDARLKAITDTRTALLAGLVGVGALLTFWLNSRTHRLTKQGQITDRYAKAVDQLGSETLDVRLGGIYALERITHDSRSDQATIVEVLSAFVRVHSEARYRWRKHEADRRLAGWKAGVSPRQGAGSLQEDEERLWKEEGSHAERHVLQYDLPEDVQAAVTVLGRLLPRSDIPRRADLAKAYLKGAHLEGANLEGANLEEAHLEEAHLEGAHLEEAHLEGAHLKGANLQRAFLAGAHLDGANLTGAHLDDAELGAADLPRKHLDGASLGSAKGLTAGQLKRAHWDSGTTLPDDVRQQLEHSPHGPAGPTF
jgi:hypothetical protein